MGGEIGRDGADLRQQPGQRVAMPLGGDAPSAFGREPGEADRAVGGDEKPRLDGDFSDIGHRGAVAAWFAGGSWLGAAVGK